MNHLARTGTDPVPLDFNTSGHIDTVADASVIESRLSGDAGAPAPDAEALLKAVGLPAHVARRVLLGRSGPGAWE